MTKRSTRPIVSSSVRLDHVERRLEKIERVIMVGSGKGGVGKSFVASGLALKLAKSGYRAALFDLDIHGSSALNYLNVRPPARSTKDGLEPKKVEGGMKVMSIALLTGNNPVPVRGDTKQAIITQLFSLTNWGDIDFLVVDLPPGTGDELLSAFHIFRERSSLILVSTPSRTAISIVSRLSSLAKTERIPVTGVVLNMAFSRSDGRIEYPFGKLNRKIVESALGFPVLVEFPLESGVNAGRFQNIVLGENAISCAFQKLVRAVMR